MDLPISIAIPVLSPYDDPFDLMGTMLYYTPYPDTMKISKPYSVTWLAQVMIKRSQNDLIDGVKANLEG